MNDKLLISKEEYNEALKNYGGFLVGMLVLYSIFMVLIYKGVDIADWISGKWQSFKSLFQRKQHIDLPVDQEF